jgi:anti-anti-sigma factor
VDKPRDDAQPLVSANTCSVSCQTVRGATVVLVSGAVDAVTAPQLEEALNAALTPAPAVLIADLTETEFLSSAGMSVLMSVHDRLGDSGRFAVVADGPGTSRPLKLVGIAEVIAVYPSLDEALTALTA